MSLSDLTLQNLVTVGGSGVNLGGGGMSAGGALFVNTGANVTVQGVEFKANKANGGTASVPQSGVGGGGGVHSGNWLCK